MIDLMYKEKVIYTLGNDYSTLRHLIEDIKEMVDIDISDYKLNSICIDDNRMTIKITDEHYSILKIKIRDNMIGSILE